jgi:hypothetical protein
VTVGRGGEVDAADELVDLLEGDLGDRIRALNLEENAAELVAKGFTVVENAAPAEFINRLRRRIVELVAHQEGSGDPNLEDENDHGVYERSTWKLLGRGRVFEEAVCNPKFVALNELMLGKGYRIGLCGGTVMRGGAHPLRLHSDLYDIRQPYPEQCEVLSAIWTCDDWTEAGGATRIVPGSFKYRRPPKPGEGEDEAIPVECPKGSIILWDGATWHGTCGRTLPGERVAFRVPNKHFTRQTLESYEDLSAEIVERNPPVFSRITGRSAPYGKGTSAVADLGSLFEWMSAPSYP